MNMSKLAPGAIRTNSYTKTTCIRNEAAAVVVAAVVVAAAVAARHLFVENACKCSDPL